MTGQTKRKPFIGSWQFAAGVLSTFVVLGGVVSLSAAYAPKPVPAMERFTCTVTKVHDGDGPIWCAEGQKVRLTAIAARELDETCSTGHPCPAASGAEAREALQELAGGQSLQCEATGMSYDRVTAWCWRPDGLELNCAMVRSGKALPWPKFDRQGRLCRA